MVNPVVVMATHRRQSITTINIKTLLNQTVRPEIILVVSDAAEVVYYKNVFPSVHTVVGVNEPLGMKWQTGVSHARPFNPNPLIITGSDDILGNTFVANACRMINEKIHFVGLQRWWQHHKGEAYLCDYLAKQPLGGGRIYSQAMLEKLQYKLFDISFDRHLDDYAWLRIHRSRLKMKMCRDVEKDGLLIHAIKGDWKVMNPFDLSHKNIRLIRTDESKRVLPELFS
jgi:hypothetical protein